MKIVCYAEPKENGLLLHYPSKEIKQQLLHLWEGAKENYNGYLAVDLKKPYKSRTTGKGSQNNLFYALVTEICKETGNDNGLSDRRSETGMCRVGNKPRFIIKIFFNRC